MNPTTTLKDAAYTYVGVNALVLDRVNDVVVDRVEQITDRFAPLTARLAPLTDRFGETSRFNTARLETIVERYQGWASDIAGVVDERLDLSANVGIAKRTATRRVRELHGVVEPVLVKVQGRLPEPVAKRVSESRKQAWAVFGAPAPRRSAAASDAAANATVAPKPATAKKAPARKSSAAKKSASAKTA